MTIEYENYVIEISDDAAYTPNSTDNLYTYEKEYTSVEPYSDRFYPTSKHGVRVNKAGKPLASAIVWEIGGATTVHPNSFLVKAGQLLICCSDKVYSLDIPELELCWMKRLDPATCFGIYAFEDDILVHGELNITRVSVEGQVKWEFGGRDIFVTQDGTEAFKIDGEMICLSDCESNKYKLDRNGKEIN